MPDSAHQAPPSRPLATEPAGPPSQAPAGPPGGAAVLPDLLELDLESLRTLDHPVLADLLDELRERTSGPREMLWNFNSSF
ncbi:FXSXX-COOH protein [Streptomyces sp. SID8014]|uniref:FxSxx-COOH cyclophane-containing RiPP peptide n=1 Tax=Streptomyces sp. SID8014 TaxID=2706097 RepID=UPI0013BDD119|nr:FxSxx-COOH cyclophane-containing RiPP peptide [Streptomyces sp. SID8014]NEC12565.1 FXSXX-COOH protein [Streptomyces sp. SID8014]